MTISPYQAITVGALALAVIATAVSFTLSDQAYRAGARLDGFWWAVSGSAWPAVALGACGLWLRSLRRRGETTASIKWLRPLLWLGIAFLASVTAILWRAM